MAVSECPVCTFHIAVGQNMQQGDAMQCPDCGAPLKLINLYPPIFEKIGEE